MQRKNLILAVFGLIFLVYLGWWGWLQTRTDHETIYNFLFNIVYGLPLLVIPLIPLYRLLKNRGSREPLHSVVRWGSLGILSFGIAQTIWTYYNLWGGFEVPEVKPTDLFYFLYYFCSIVALVKLTALNRDPVSQKRLLTSLPVVMIITGIALAVIWPKAFQGDPIALILNSSYVISDSVLLILTITNFAALGTKINRALIPLLLGVIIMSAGDMLYMYRAAIETYWNGDIVDGLLALGTLDVALAVVLLMPGRVQNQLPPTAPEQPAGGAV